jgi:hypothetical protein
MHQTCVTCKTSKPLNLFPVRGNKTNYRTLGRSLSTHDERCNACKAEYAREFRKRNPGYRGTGKIKNVPVEDRLLASAISDRLQHARVRTKQLGHPALDVDREYLYQLFKEQDGRCALSGVVLKVEKRAVTCLSLDQKVPSLGYVRGNVQWVAWAVNRAKGDMNQDMFIDMCDKVLEYQKVQRLSPSGSTPKRVEAQNP